MNIDTYMVILPKEYDKPDNQIIHTAFLYCNIFFFKLGFNFGVNINLLDRGPIKNKFDEKSYCECLKR